LIRDGNVFELLDLEVEVWNMLTSDYVSQPLHRVKSLVGVPRIVDEGDGRRGVVANVALGKVERGGDDAVVLILGVDELPNELLKAKVSYRWGEAAMPRRRGSQLTRSLG
jgi:hypothetical protein